MVAKKKKKSLRGEKKNLKREKRLCTGVLGRKGLGGRKESKSREGESLGKERKEKGGEGKAGSRWE